MPPRIKISDLREMAASGCAQKKMAETIGCSQSTISDILNKQEIPHLSRQGARPATRSNRGAHPLMRRLVNARVDRGITQDKVARIAGYHPTQIGEWESGYRKISLPAACDLANALGFDLVLRERSQ